MQLSKSMRKCWNDMENIPASIFKWKKQEQAVYVLHFDFY